jgi:hypothetical protein
MGLDLVEVFTELQVHRSSIMGSLMIPPQIAEFPRHSRLGGLGKFAHRWRPDRFPLNQRPKIYGIDVSKDLLDTGVLKSLGMAKHSAHRCIPT